MIRYIRHSTARARIAGQHKIALSKKLDRFLAGSIQTTIHVPKAIKVVFEVGIGGSHDVALRWDGDSVIIAMPLRLARWLHHTRVDQLFAAMIWFLKAGKQAEYMTVNISDGEMPSVARFAPSVFSPHTIPLPDEYFFSTFGFESVRKLTRTKQSPWRERSNNIVWRGAPVGTGLMNCDPYLSTHQSVVQRIRLAHLAQNTEVDFRFVSTNLTASMWETVIRANLAGERIEESTWYNRKYAIDVDGFTNTWSNLFIRLLYGCCVLKVESQFGYRQWYYDELEPYEHYVPVKADLSDFFEQVDWVKSNPLKSEAIAKSGQAFAEKMTFHTEAEVAAKAILENWRWPISEHTSPDAFRLLEKRKSIKKTSHKSGR